MGRVDAPLAVVRPSQNPDLRLSRIRLFAKRIVHIYQLYTLTYIRGLTNIYVLFLQALQDLRYVCLLKQTADASSLHHADRLPLQSPE